MLRFPRLYAAASLKPTLCERYKMSLSGFPRLYAAASLKRGLFVLEIVNNSGFPRLYAAASLKLAAGKHGVPCELCVFRGFMPRPH